MIFDSSVKLIAVQNLLYRLALLVVKVYEISYTPFTRYNRLSNRLYDRFDNRLYRINKHPTSCQTGLTTGLTTVLNE